MYFWHNHLCSISVYFNLMIPWKLLANSILKIIIFLLLFGSSQFLPNIFLGFSNPFLQYLYSLSLLLFSLHIHLFHVEQILLAITLIWSWTVFHKTDHLSFHRLLKTGELLDVEPFIKYIFLFVMHAILLESWVLEHGILRKRIINCNKKAFKFIIAAI